MNYLISYRKLFHHSKAGKVTGLQKMTSTANSHVFGQTVFLTLVQ